MTEYSAKSLFDRFSGRASDRIFIEDRRLPRKEVSRFLEKHKQAVAKLDQGVKKRGKQGLVRFFSDLKTLEEFISSQDERFSDFIIEPYISHRTEEERYLAFQQEREGVVILYSDKGGVEIEESWSQVKKAVLPYAEFFDKKWHNFVERFFGNRAEAVEHYLRFFSEYPFVFLELNPLLELKGKFLPLDMAAEIDDQELYFYPDLDLKIVSDLDISEAERKVEILNSRTPASLKLKIINPNGSVWLLLSGGGASIVLADALSDMGYGDRLANYGEYSGNPTQEDTYLYTKIIIKEMLKSKAKRKVLIIAGGVANFTDVYETFKGIILALKENLFDLQRQKIKVFVRRGGPNERLGLSILENFLGQNKIKGKVLSSKDLITSVIDYSIKNI